LKTPIFLRLKADGVACPNVERMKQWLIKLPLKTQKQEFCVVKYPNPPACRLNQCGIHPNSKNFPRPHADISIDPPVAHASPLDDFEGVGEMAATLN
tara:strand:- start:264 stop:554 length:291 start_codon:yes stop_codon:yes gene_type:complete